MGSGSARGKVKEFIYLLEDLTPDQVQGMGMEELKAFCGHAQRLRPQGRPNRAATPWLDEKLSASSLFSRSIRFGEHLRRGYCASPLACAEGQKDPLIEYKNEGYDMFLK